MLHFENFFHDSFDQVSHKVYDVTNEPEIAVQVKTEYKVFDSVLDSLKNWELLYSTIPQPERLITSADNEHKKLYSDIMHSKASVADYVLSLLDEYNNYRAISSLQSITKVKKPHESPNKDELSRFEEAFQSTYHGVNYNIDARGSENHDRLLRKQVLKSIRYETMSIGSKSQVASLMVAIKDTPSKKYKSTKQKAGISRHGHKRPAVNVRKNLVVTPVKKKHGKLFTMSSPSTRKRLKTTPSKKIRTLGKNKFTPRKSKCTPGKSKPTPGKTKLTPGKRKALQGTKLVSTKEKTDRKILIKKTKEKNQRILRSLVYTTLEENGIGKSHEKYSCCSNRLYQLSYTFLKDLKSSKNLENNMKRVVTENVKTVLALELSS